jgi:hypothetical protein
MIRARMARRREGGRSVPQCFVFLRIFLVTPGRLTLRHRAVFPRAAHIFSCCDATKINIWKCLADLFEAGSVNP